jgi:hypothetical protein
MGPELDRIAGGDGSAKKVPTNVPRLVSARLAIGRRLSSARYFNNEEPGTFSADAAIADAYRRPLSCVLRCRHVSDATSAGRLDEYGGNHSVMGLDVLSGSEIFWTALSERRGGLELPGGSQRQTNCHEPAVVARCCSPAKLLGFPKLVGTPRCNDARRCDQCDWHSQGGRPAMASCRTSGQLRRVSRLTHGMQ